MKKIAIVGISGSGKSTLANNLGKKLNLPVHHLDKYFWDNNWQQRYTKEEFKALVESFIAQDKWIIDGNYTSANIDLRFEVADTIILLDIPKWKGIWRAFTRTFNKEQPFDKTEGAKEQIDWELVMWIVKYKTKRLREWVGKFKNSKNVFVLKNDKEINNFLLNISNI